MTHSLIRRHTQTHTNTRLSVAASHHTQVCHIYGEGENHNRMRYSRMHTRRNQNKNDFDALFVVSPPKPLLLSLYLSTVLRVVSTWFLCFASWHRVCLLFDQLWMSNSGKLNAVHPFIYAQNWNRLWCRWQREIKKTAPYRATRMKMKQCVDFFGYWYIWKRWKRSVYVYVCTYEIHTLDLKESERLEVYGAIYEADCGTMNARLKLCTWFVIAQSNLLIFTWVRFFEHMSTALCLNANQTKFEFTG